MSKCCTPDCPNEVDWENIEEKANSICDECYTRLLKAYGYVAIRKYIQVVK